MRSRLFIRLMLIALLLGRVGVGMLFALPIECVGTATQRIIGGDTVFIFRDEIHLRSNIGAVEWYKADGSLYASGVDEIYPDEGTYRVGNKRFVVMKYQDADSLAFMVETTCDNTILHITGDPTFLARPHTLSLSYNALAWNSEAWVDSLATDTVDLASKIYLPPLYGPTPITLCYDDLIRASLGLPPACITVDVPIEDIKAVKMQLTSLAVTRGKEGEKSNERNRPTSQTLIQGSDYSGPLEVAFYSNPTPAVQFFRWTIYKATERIVTRMDNDIRYTFLTPGSYRVVCYVSNTYCEADSMEMTVAVSESFLAVPNVFTPDGNGQNDEFRVSYRSLREFHCWVYNRWGKLVYEWTDPAKGWDGTINGRPAAEGAYYYVIRALGTDAAKNAQYIGLKASYQKKKANADESVIGVYQLSGDINLLRKKQ